MSTFCLNLFIGGNGNDFTQTLGSLVWEYPYACILGSKEEQDMTT